MTAPVLALVCPACDWRPAGDLTVGMLKAHAVTEHGHNEASDDLQLDLRAFCPRDGIDLGEPAISHDLGGGALLHQYDCTTCLRTYVLHQGAKS